MRAVWHASGISAPTEVAGMQVALEMISFAAGVALALVAARLVLGAFLTIAFGRQ